MPSDYDSVTERALLTTALTDLAAERGYPHLTLTEVLRRTGLDAEDFHRHFADLDACAAAAVQAGTEELLARAGAAFLAEQGWRNQLRAVAYALLAFLQENPARAHLMVIDSLEAGPETIAIREGGMQGLTELIDQGRQEMDDPDSVPRAAAETTAGVIYNRMHVAIEAGDLSAGEGMVPELMFTAVLPYLGIEAALEELEIPAPPR
jgi:AcrR family transcriptional regulator